MSDHEFTQEEITRYLEQQAEHCPFCQSASLSGYEVIHLGTEIEQKIFCENCGSGWFEVFKLVSICGGNDERESDDEDQDHQEQPTPESMGRHSQTGNAGQPESRDQESTDQDAPSTERTGPGRTASAGIEGLTSAEFDAILAELMDEHYPNASQLLGVAGIYEVMAEELNNDVIARWEERSNEE